MQSESGFLLKDVTVRFVNPPLHDLLPSAGEKFDEEISLLANRLRISFEECTEKVSSFNETNPLLGLRGCRLSVIHPEITEMQTVAALGEIFSWNK